MLAVFNCFNFHRLPVSGQIYQLFQNLLLIFAMFMGGWIGMEMAVPPGYASPIWPPTGIALTALLVWGRKFWLGIWLGAIANQFLAVIFFTEHFTYITLYSSLLTATASTVQAGVALNLSAKYLRPGLPKLDEPFSIFRFFIIVGPISCLIASTLGVCTLVLLKVMPLSAAAVSWWNWWVGDTLGVLIVAPLGFCLFGKPNKLWRERRMTVALPLLGLLMALSIVFTMVYTTEQARVQLSFDNQAAAVDRLLVGYADNVIDSTLSLRDMFAVSKQVERQEFNWYSKRLLERHPEIQALEWLPRIPFSALSAFEKQVQADGFPDFKVTELDKNGQLQAVTRRSEYFPIMYLEPMQGNEKAFGYDSITNPLSLQSKQLAKQSSLPSASQRLRLMQGQKDLGILVSIPVYDSIINNTSEKLLGFVSSIVLPARIAEVALKNFNASLLGVSVHDLSADSDQSELFNKPVIKAMGKNYRVSVWTHDFPFADRIWQLQIVPDSRFIIENGSTLPWITLTGGLFFSSLFTTLLLTISGKTAYVEALVADRTIELARTNAELQASEIAARDTALMLTTLIDSQPECIKLLNAEGVLLRMNKAGLDLIEADSVEQVLGSKVDRLVLEKYRLGFNQLITDVFAGKSGQMEFEIQGLKGIHRWLDTHVVPMRDAVGNIQALLAITRDISNRKQSEQHLKLAARVFSEAHEGILITDASGKIIDVNPTFCEITGYSHQEVIGENPRILRSNKQSPDFYQAMWQSLLINKHWQGELWNRKKSGELFAELLTISVLSDEEGVPSYYVGLFSDITQSKYQQEQLQMIAHYDPLTGLPNRVLFADRLNQAIAHARREKSYLAICFLDLDGFKPINDQYGHDAGDQVLVQVADRIRQCIREEDSVSRHGGDEFVLLLGDIHSLDQCHQAIERIHRMIAEHYIVNEHKVLITASSGLTLFPLDDADPDTLLRHADQAMYQAKLAGKNRHSLFDAGQNQQIIDHHKRLRDIEDAFMKQAFRLYYQPKLDVKHARIYGVEALLRWLDKERGLIPPMEFLPTIASTELEIRIGNWVIEQAWQQLASWHQQGLALEVSVNISAYHLLWPGFFTHLQSVMQNYPEVSSRFFQLEILESTSFDDLAAVKRIMQRCHEHLGIQIALDDFGTGYASLTHFRHFAIDTIKIDQSFVRDMLDDPDDYAIIESIIGLSQAFRREVIAEGVENQQQGEVLVLLNCHLLQGYFIARPMPNSEISQWIQVFKLNSHWQHYADNELTPKQGLIKILLIASQQWFERIEACLKLESSAPAIWPILNYSKAYSGQWLKQARQSQAYANSWLEQLEQRILELFLIAKVIKEAVENADHDTRQREFVRLQTLHQHLLTFIQHYR